MLYVSTHAPPTKARSTPPTRRRLLVVDDDAAIARMICRALASQYEVRVAIDALEALALVLEGELFELILCDMQMPSMEGIELYEAIAIMAPAQARQIVFLTGADPNEIRDRVPGAEVIRKTFSLVGLRQAVRKRLLG